MNTDKAPDTGNENFLNPKQIELGHELGDWFIFRQTRHFGPLTTKQVNQLLLNRLISIDHHIWRPGLKAWISLKCIESFRSCGTFDIENISDNDFSFQAQLGSIDRIKFQDKEMSFANLDSVKVVSIKGQDGLVDKMNSFKFIMKQSAFLLGRQLGLNKDNIRYYQVGLGLSSIALLFLFGILINNLYSAKSFISDLPTEIKAQLISNAKKPATTKDPSLVFYEKDTPFKDPVFVGSVNLPSASKIRVDIQGNPDSLLNAFRFGKSVEINLTSPYFQTGAIRGDQGEYLPAGEYNVSVTCLSCDKKNLELYSSTHKFGLSGLSSYNQQLESFHSKARESASIELNELIDLNETLLGQYQKSLNIYNRSLSSKNLAAWNRFSVDWLGTQKNIVEMFEQLKSADLKSKIYYLTLYQAYGTVTQMIFELHVLQDSFLNGKDKSLELAGKINNLAQNIKLKSTYLKSQVDLMKVNYDGSKALPPKTGLNLKDFK